VYALLALASFAKGFILTSISSPEEMSSRVALALHNAVLLSTSEHEPSSDRSVASASSNGNTETKEDAVNTASEDLMIQAFGLASAMVDACHLELVCHMIQSLFRAQVINFRGKSDNASRDKSTRVATTSNNQSSTAGAVPKQPDRQQSKNSPCAAVFPIRATYQRGFRRLPPTLPPAPRVSMPPSSPKQPKVPGLRRRRPTFKRQPVSRSRSKGALFLHLLSFLGEGDFCMIEATCVGIRDLLLQGPFAASYTELWRQGAQLRFALLHKNLDTFEIKRLPLPQNKAQVRLLTLAISNQKTWEHTREILPEMTQGNVIQLSSHMPAARSLFGNFTIQRADMPARERALRAALAVLTQLLQPCTLIFPPGPEESTTQLGRTSAATMAVSSAGKVQLNKLDINAIAARIALEQVHATHENNTRSTLGVVVLLPQ
jgi:hypothetical protein